MKLLRAVNIVQILVSTWDGLQHFRWKYSNNHLSSNNENQDYITIFLYALEQIWILGIIYRFSSMFLSIHNNCIHTCTVSKYKVWIILLHCHCIPNAVVNIISSLVMVIMMDHCQAWTVSDIWVLYFYGHCCNQSVQYCGLIKIVKILIIVLMGLRNTGGKLYICCW